MKAGAENRKKTVALGVLGALALCGVLYNVSSLFGGPSTPPPAIVPISTTPAPTRSGAGAASSSSNRSGSGSGAIPGVAAQRLATSAASLDPTLDQAAMLRTEGLVYSGSGRNIFSATYVAPAPVMPKGVPPPRPLVRAPSFTPTPGPSGPPLIPLKFFGTVQRGQGAKQAFLLSGDDVYLASPGDIVAKRFRIGQIQPFGVSVTDLGSNNTQVLPLQQQ